MGAVRHVALPAVERIQRAPVSKHLQDLERSQWWSLDQLHALQVYKLRRLLSFAYAHVPLYRSLWEEAGVRPQDIQSREDMQRLPLTTKEVLRAAYPHRAVARGVDRRQLVPYASSGSTGQPLQFVMTRREKGQRWANMFRCWAWTGLHQGMRCANLKDGHALGTFHGGAPQQLEQRVTNMLNLSAFAVHDGRVGQVIDAMLDFQPHYLLSYPASAGRLAEAMREQGVSLPLRGVITSGERLFPFQRRVIEEQFLCQVFDFYGGEGMDVAMQCGHGTGYHINVESVLLEVVDKQGRPVEPGQEGQIVLTNLNNYAMPFVRYAIADVGALAPADRVCSCGRQLPLLDHVVGRSSDQLVLPSGRALIMWNFTDLFRRMPGIDTFQMRQASPHQILVQVVPGRNFGHLPGDHSHRTGAGTHEPGPYIGQEEALAHLRRWLQEEIGSEAALEVRLVESIPPGPGGKHRFFIADNAHREGAIDPAVERPGSTAASGDRLNPRRT